MNRNTIWQGGLFILLSVPLKTLALCEAVGAFSINAGSITVQRDAQVGQPISDWLYSGRGMSYQNCNYDTMAQYSLETGVRSNNGRSSGLLYATDTVFDTNLPGVGFIIEGESHVNTSAWAPWRGIQVGRTEWPIFYISNAVGIRHSFGHQARILLVKTHTIQGGTLSGPVGTFYVGIRETGAWSPEVPISFSGGVVTVLACSVSTPNVSVALGKQPKSVFSGINSGTAWQDFSIGLDCDRNARVNVQINAVAYPGITGVMRLDSAPGVISI
ncbi:fimbrial protein [Entomohabitans teleogrylli]|uniref:fimbrial protein n=1 Tax=Entomohabitans teleogrylli TaxID=1384589 RepID=UPI00073D3194|nr:type 1 fimbrial protein [Entomohabitans teleogrylli]